MDYLNVLMLDNNACLIDVIGMYKALLEKYKREVKQGNRNIESINELNFAFLLACTNNNQNPLVKAKNNYLLNNKIIILPIKYLEAIRKFSNQTDTGLGVCFNYIITLLKEHLNHIYHLINQVRRAKDKKELEKSILEFNSLNWVESFKDNILTYIQKNLMPGLAFTREVIGFRYDLARIKNEVELIDFLTSNINFFQKLEIANQTLITNILYNNNRNNLSYEDAMILSNCMTKKIIEDVISNKLKISDLVCKYTTSKIEMEEKQLIRELGFHEGPNNGK